MKVNIFIKKNNIDLLIGVCAYLLARINYIEDTTKDN